MSAFEYGFFDELEKLASDPRIVQPLLRPKARKFKQLGLTPEVQGKLHATRFRRAVREGAELPEHATIYPNPAIFNDKGPGYLPAGSLPVVRGERFHTRGSADGPELQAADRKAMSRRDIGDFATLYAQGHADKERLKEPQHLYDKYGIGRFVPGNLNELNHAIVDVLNQAAAIRKHKAEGGGPPIAVIRPSYYTGFVPKRPRSVRTPEQEQLRRTREQRRAKTLTPAQFWRDRRLRREAFLESRQQTIPRLA